MTAGRKRRAQAQGPHAGSKSQFSELAAGCGWHLPGRVEDASCGLLSPRQAAYCKSDNPAPWELQRRSAEQGHPHRALYSLELGTPHFV